MRLISVDKLEPGLVVSENIYTIDDRLVLPKGTVLDATTFRGSSHILFTIFLLRTRSSLFLTRMRHRSPIILMLRRLGTLRLLLSSNRTLRTMPVRSRRLLSSLPMIRSRLI